MNKMIKLISVIMILAALCMSGVSAAVAGYVLGDADGNGYVDITDATLIRRVIVGIYQDADGGVAQRGDVDGENGVDIVDATYIMRYCVSIKTPFRIGQAVEIPEPTQPPTQKPTYPRDPYELPLV